MLAASPDTFTETESVAGGVPEAGVTVNQDAELWVAVKPVFGLALTETDCAGGDVPPTAAEKDSDVGLTVSVGVELVMVSVTGTV